MCVLLHHRNIDNASITNTYIPMIIKVCIVVSSFAFFPGDVSSLALSDIWRPGFFSTVRMCSTGRSNCRYM
jgi:hypothetical protein